MSMHLNSNYFTQTHICTPHTTQQLDLLQSSEGQRDRKVKQKGISNSTVECAPPIMSILMPLFC